MISPWMSQGNLFKALESDPPPERRLHLVRDVAQCVDKFVTNLSGQQLRGVAEGLEHRAWTLLYVQSIHLQFLSVHSLKIIHGDLYPVSISFVSGQTCIDHLTTAKANVLIDDNGNACLTDFGLSFIVPDFIDTSYWSRSVGGAMRWRAPELIPASPTAEIESAGDLTTMCDIWSFGSLALHVSKLAVQLSFTLVDIFAGLIRSYPLLQRS